MREDAVNPEDRLRSLAAKALRWALHRPLFPDSLGLMAVANAWWHSALAGGCRG